MTILRGTLRSTEITPEHPTGRPVGGVRVWARLHASTLFLADGTGEVVRDAPTLTATGTGIWSFDLVPHELLLDAEGSWYEITIPSYGVVHSVRLPTDEGPYDVEDVLVDPDSLEPVEIDVDPFYVPTTWVGAADGVAPLGTDAKVPAQYLPPGGGGSSLRHDYVQEAPLATWPIVHNFGRDPEVTLIDSAGNRYLTDLSYPDVNTVVVTHGEPTTGRAILLG